MVPFSRGFQTLPACWIGDWRPWWCTVQKWHIVFQDNANKFPHPNPQVAAGKKPNPPFFLEFLEAKLSIIRKADKLLKIRELSVQNLVEHVNDTLVPRLNKEHHNFVGEDNHLTKFQFLKSIGFTRNNNEEDGDDEEANIWESTICKWTVSLGYSWCRSTKHFYSDKHEHPLTVACWQDFVRRTCLTTSRELIAGSRYGEKIQCIP